MKNQHKKSNQLSLLNIIVIVCYLCLLVGTPISVLNFWTNGENEVLNQLWVIPACTQLLLAAIWWLAREAFATSATYLRRCFACMTLAYVITFITRIVPTDYTEVSVQTMIAITVYGISGIIAFVASIMISVRLIRHYTGSKHTLGIVIIAGLVTNILCSLVQGIYPIVAEADVQTVCLHRYQHRRLRRHCLLSTHHCERDRSCKTQHWNRRNRRNSIENSVNICLRCRKLVILHRSVE
ncbi:MAG TPA: hypothetical protein DCL91_01885 [Prevotella stercorea]|nr:hypothetical protein [Leyella stercorea]